MASIIPDRAQLIAEENKVTPPITSVGGQAARGAYDLHLYHALNAPGFGVLVVSVNLEMDFQSGTSSLPATLGTALHWAPHEITDFMDKAKNAIETVWTNQHPIVIQGDALPTLPSVIGVKYEIDVRARAIRNRHWKLTVRKTDDHLQSEVDRPTNTAQVDSMDVIGRVRRGHTQRGIVHEFGHMQGLRDEYDADVTGFIHIGDRPSVMNNGESVRPRHYAPLAHWLTQKFAPLSSVRRALGRMREMQFKVVHKDNFLVDVSNAALE
jgi:hypothetical protein